MAGPGFELEGGTHSQIISYSMQSVLLGGSGGLPTRKIMDFRPSEIVSGAVSEQIS